MNTDTFKKKILVVTFSDLSIDLRVNRQLEWLNKTYSVSVIGFGTPYINNVTTFSIPNNPKTLTGKIKSALFLLSRKFLTYYWNHQNVLSSMPYLKENEFDLIIANDIDTLPLAIRMKKKAKLLFDAHEYSPEEFNDNLLWRFFYKRYKKKLCQNFISQANITLTVSEGIAKRYFHEFKVNPYLIYNAPKYLPLKPSTVHKDHIKIVFHSMAMKGRGIKSLISLISILDEKYTLDLYLVPKCKKYYTSILNLIKNNSRITIHNPVKGYDICKELNQYDIGILMLPNTNFNNRHCLPNKFFEYIQSRLALVMPPLIEIKNIVNEYQCGIITNGFSTQDFAYSLSKLDKNTIELHKKKSDLAARELCSDLIGKNFNTHIKSLIT